MEDQQSTPQPAAAPSVSGGPVPEDVTPEEFRRRFSNALARLPDAPLVIDFDETLFLRNSTNEFLRAARPRLLARGICKLVQIGRLWTVLPGDDKAFVYRDWLRVLAVSILMPWTIPVWKSRTASRLARRHMNDAILSQLGGRDADDITVISFGFRPVVTPLLRHSGLDCRIVATPLLGQPTLRRNGKLPALVAAIGAEHVARSICISDSDDDRDVLQACAVPLFLRSTEARRRPPFG